MQVEALKLTPVSMSATSHLHENQVQTENKNFGEYLTDALKETNDLQNRAKDMNIALAAGQVDDISQVVLATEKANIALQLTMQVRNKAVEAYQEIMRMQV
jgi:flagellar hook-basal body complex protein FliE